MSAKNSLAAKQSRRAVRETHSTVQAAKQGLEYRLLPLPNGGYSKFYGECQTCYLRKMINLTQNLQQVNLDHSCKLEFLTQEQYTSLDEAVAIYVQRLQEEEEDKNQDEHRPGVAEGIPEDEHTEEPSSSGLD